MTGNQRDDATANVKYVFLDVVGYSHERSVEAQSEIIGSLNEIVRDALSAAEIATDSTIKIPTGDGICIALLNVANPFDVDIALALGILAALDDHNRQQTDAMRRFDVRIGLNEGADVKVTDINGQENVAGPTINMCQRIMNMGDARQVIVGGTVEKRLAKRDKYFDKFKAYPAKVKHGERVKVAQYIDDEYPFLSTDTPSHFRPTVYREPKLSELAATYLAKLIQNESFISSEIRAQGHGSYAMVVLMYHLACDDLEARRLPTSLEEPFSKLTVEGGDLMENWKVYADLPISVASDIDSMLGETVFSGHTDCFEKGGLLITRLLVVSAKGRDKLAAEWPPLAAKVANGEEPKRTG